MSEELGLFFAGCIAGFILTCILAACLLGNRVPVDLDGFGKIACEEKGYTYLKFEFRDTSNKIPTIICKNETAKSILDGIVVLE